MIKNMADECYRKTLTLPHTDFPMRAGLPLREPNWLQRWQRLGIYDRLRQKTARKSFILHDGPPYANGHLHIGHALNKILKDFIVRSQQMLGKDSRYVPGWDCHGLPIEWKIEERYRQQGKNKNDVTIIDLRRDCRNFALKWIDIQCEEFKRLGVIGKWDDPYLTMDYGNEAVIAAEFMTFLMNGTLYQRSKPVMWSPVEKTALAEAEIEYHDYKSPAIWVAFTIKADVVADLASDLSTARVVIWTTTPWTIPSNKAICFNPNLHYGLYEVVAAPERNWMQSGERYLFEHKCVVQSMAATNVQEYKHIRNVSGEELAALVCTHPLAALDDFWNYDVPLLAAKHVSNEIGTGFVHTAPSHGTDDYEVFVKQGWTDRMTYNIGENSDFLPHVPLFAGLSVFNDKGKKGAANDAVMASLQKVNALIGRKMITHSYPHSWRSKAPIIFRNTPQWFVAIDYPLGGNNKHGKTIRERALRVIDQQVQWTPKTGRNRLHAMIKARPDWVLSRQRVWGVPLTCFIRKGAHAGDNDFILRNHKVNKRIITAFKNEGADCWYFANAKQRFLDGIAGINPNDWQQVFDILDVWFDSGSTHAFVVRDRSDGRADGIADLYLEGTDQHRGWFHSSLLQACGTVGRSPYRGVLTHGFTLDKKGMKMSKSVGNTFAPNKVIKQYGADILRLWVAQSDYSSDLRIGDEILKNTADSYRRLRNSMRFILGNLNDWQADEAVEYSQMPDLERWILHRLFVLDKQVRIGYELYNFQGVFQQLFRFCTHDLSALYFDIRKDVLYCDGMDSLKRRAARTVLDILYQYLVVWFAPILVFTMEEIWLQRHNDDQDSVHLQDFPITPDAWHDVALANKWDKLFHLRHQIMPFIEAMRQKKQIGSSLEAAATIFTQDNATRTLIETVDFTDICIVSSVKIITDPQRVNAQNNSTIIAVIAKAEGQKCMRCWKILPEVAENSIGLCKRCDSAVKKWQDKREFV